MLTARRVRPDAISFGSGQGTTGKNCARLVHLWENRVVLGPETVGNIRTGNTVGSRVAGRFDGGNVRGRVYAEEVDVTGRCGFEELDTSSSPEATGEFHRQVEAGRIHRVIVTPPITQVLRTPHHNSICSRRRGVLVRSDRGGHGNTLLRVGFVPCTTLFSSSAQAAAPGMSAPAEQLDSPLIERHKFSGTER